MHKPSSILPITHVFDLTGNVAPQLATLLGEFVVKDREHDQWTVNNGKQILIHVSQMDKDAIAGNAVASELQAILGDHLEIPDKCDYVLLKFT